MLVVFFFFLCGLQLAIFWALLSPIHWMSKHSDFMLGWARKPPNPMLMVLTFAVISAFGEFGIQFVPGKNDYSSFWTFLSGWTNCFIGGGYQEDGEMSLGIFLVGIVCLWSSSFPFLKDWEQWSKTCIILKAMLSCSHHYSKYSYYFKMSYLMTESCKFQILSRCSHLD